MANNKTKRLRPIVLQEDLDAYAALLAIVGYKPSNIIYDLANITGSKAKMGESQTAEVQKKVEADASRDTSTTDERDFHDMMIGVKEQVKAQFGANSNEYAALGMKKKNEYKTGKRKSATVATP